MHIDLPVNGNISEISRPYKEHFDKQFSYETVKHEKQGYTIATDLLNKISNYSTVTYRTKPTIWRILPLLPIKHGNRPRFIPKQEIWPSFTTNSPDPVKSNNLLYHGIFGGVSFVVFIWVMAMIIHFRNKQRAKQQRRRENLPPSYINVQSTAIQNSSDFSRMNANSQFELSNQSESSIVDIQPTAPNESLPSFTINESFPSHMATSSRNSNYEDPPSYEEIQHKNKNMNPSSYEEQPPSYLEVQQRTKETMDITRNIDVV